MATLYKRKGSKFWWGKFTWHGQNKRKSLETTSRPVAKKRADEWETEIKGQKWGEGPRVTYDAAMEQFILDHLPTLTPAAARRYKVSARMLTPFLEGMYLDKITTGTLADYEKARRKHGASSPTIRRDLACLSSMLTHAQVEMDWEGTNLVTVFLKRQRRRGRLKEAAPRDRYLSHAEESALLAKCTGDLADQVAFAIDTGLRLEEQLSLTWGQVNFERQEVTVIGKGRKKRTVPLLARALEILKRTPRHIRRDATPDWVFCKRDGTRYGKRTRGLTAAIGRAKIPHATWHDLRRTCGCRLFQDRKMSKDNVQEWLGHESVQQTERAYAFLGIDQLHDAVGTFQGTGRADSEVTGPPEKAITT